MSETETTSAATTEVVAERTNPLVVALVELVAVFHHVNCRGPSWETCANPECVKVREVLLR